MGNVQGCCSTFYLYVSYTVKRIIAKRSIELTEQQKPNSNCVEFILY